MSFHLAYRLFYIRLSPGHKSFKLLYGTIGDGSTFYITNATATNGFIFENIIIYSHRRCN